MSPIYCITSQKWFIKIRQHLHMSAPSNRNFITLIINEMSSSLQTSLFLKKQKLEIVKSFQDIAIIDKVSPGGSEWQKPPGNKK